MVNHRNYWFQTCPTKQTVSSGIVRNADVLIIGGGIAGVTMLHQLLMSGISNVYLVEESSIGFHASGRNGGQLMLRGSNLFHELPEEDGVEYLKFISENNKRFLNGLRNVSFDTELRDSGGIRFAIDEEEMEILEREANFIRENGGIDCPLLTQKDTTNILPQSNFSGGMFVPNEVNFNPYKIVNGLRELVEKKGSRILTGCQVVSVTEDDRGLAVSIRHKGTIRAKKVVYCTNGYTTELLPQLKSFMTPCRGQMIATDYLPAHLINVVPTMTMTCNNSHEYFRLHQGRILAGGKRQSVRAHQRNIINDGEMSPGVYDRLRIFIGEAMPFIKDIKITHSWSGIMSETADGLPLIGLVPGKRNEYILAGFNGYGYSHALQGSMIVKDLIRMGHSKSPGVRLFDPARILKKKKGTS